MENGTRGRRRNGSFGSDREHTLNESSGNNGRMDECATGTREDEEKKG